METRIVCLMGIDGSGKSSLAQLLIHNLQNKGYKTRYVHAYHEPILLLPVKWMARLIFLKGVDQTKNYSIYKEKKSLSSSNHRFLSNLYGWLWLFDYSVQVFFKVVLPATVHKKEFMVFDRYIFDTAINIAVSLNMSEDWIKRVVEKWLIYNLKPDYKFWVQIPEEIAFSRKNDISSLEYLSERQKYYQIIADRYNFIRLDGEKILESNINHILSQIPV